MKGGRKDEEGNIYRLGQTVRRRREEMGLKKNRKRQVRAFRHDFKDISGGDKRAVNGELGGRDYGHIYTEEAKTRFITTEDTFC